MKDAAQASLSPRGVCRSRPYPGADQAALSSTGREEIRKSLEPFGYYNAKVPGELRGHRQGGHEAFYQVELGDPVRVSKSSVKVLGSGASA